MAISFKSLGASSKQKKVALFTSTGSWTAPTGVTYAIATILAGGGGGGSGSGGSSGSSSSCFGTTAYGGVGTPGSNDFGSENGVSGQQNTGNGGSGSKSGPPNQGYIPTRQGGNSTLLTAGSAVTPGTSYTVTVGGGGSGGSGNGGNGGSGYVAIEYYE